MKTLKNSIDISEARCQVTKDGHVQGFKLLHNLPPRSFSILGSRSFQSWARLLQVLTLCVKAGLAHWEPLQFPMGEEEQQAWVLDCLLHSTRGFSKPGVAASISNEVQKLLKTVSAGKESEHLLHVLEFCDFRGSEVSVRDSTVNEGHRQVIPYPAMVWAWRSVQAYAWQQPHHINVLELIAFFNYLRACVRKPNNHCSRMLHVLDSRVASCVIAKGRSSSCKLNRILRRVSALLLASEFMCFRCGLCRGGILRTMELGPCAQSVLNAAKKEAHAFLPPVPGKKAHKSSQHHSPNSLTLHIRHEFVL